MAQLSTCGVTLPMYFLTYVRSMPVLPAILPHDALPRARSVLPAVMLGCVLPSAALLLAPSSMTLDTKQIIAAIWQPFPIYIALCLALLQSATSSPGDAARSSTAKAQEAYLYIKRSYNTTDFRSGGSYAYPSGWNYAYSSQTNAQSQQQLVAQPSYVPTQYSPGPSQNTARESTPQHTYTSNYPPGQYSYPYSTGTYPRPATQQPTEQVAWPQGQSTVTSHYMSNQSHMHSQHTHGAYAQPSNPYPQAGATQRPAYTAMAYQGPADGGFQPQARRSRTPQELRWQQPYQGPKSIVSSQLSSARGSQSTSRSSSIHVQSRNSSRAQSTLPSERLVYEPLLPADICLPASLPLPP